MLFIIDMDWRNRLHLLPTYVGSILHWLNSSDWRDFQEEATSFQMPPVKPVASDLPPPPPTHTHCSTVPYLAQQCMSLSKIITLHK